MCGIIGVAGAPEALPVLLSGLRRLEYRGYDSAGIAVTNGVSLSLCKQSGKLARLETRLDPGAMVGGSGIGHTRWATHGAPKEHNAHPHATDRVAVVHNGIIENFRELRNELENQGRVFASETDSETILFLLSRIIEAGGTPIEAMRQTVPLLQGSYAFTALFREFPNCLAVARQGAPLVVSHSQNAVYVGSDALALVEYADRFQWLEEGDWGIVLPEGTELFNRQGEPVTRPKRRVNFSSFVQGKGNYRHFMLKEIFEQPEILSRTLNHLNTEASAILDEAHSQILRSSMVSLVACGTSFHAALIGRNHCEAYLKIPAFAEIASEWRYREHALPENSLAIFISQSGETMDTLEALRRAREMKLRTIAIVNAEHSSMTREADIVLHTSAGPEIGVAASKTFLAQLMLLLRLIHREQGLALAEAAGRVASLLSTEQEIAGFAAHMLNARDVLYVGRGDAYPIALEGALKLMELTYIHAEAYAAGELKHGPLALIDDSVPVIVLAPRDRLFKKVFSNAQEIQARGAQLFCFSDSQGIAQFRRDSPSTAGFVIPESPDLLNPILYTIPMQLLAYHLAVLKGTDIDQPRNLAKSVTVE